MIKQLWRSRRLRRFLKFGVLIGGTGTILSIAAFLLASHFAQRDFQPVNDPIPPALAARIKATAHYQRDEDATYLTFTEWYLVFNPQEYAEYLHAHPPSGFPYFRAIGQIWEGYTQAFGIAQKHYTFNSGYNLMLVVIGTSSTVEFGIKGIYEGSVGRFFEWTAENEATEEELFAARAAQEYGEFVPTRPWFAFPFGKKFSGLWTETSLFGPHLARKWERKFFLSLEYGFKYFYAAAIGAASESVYGVADTEVYLTARHLPADFDTRPNVRRVEALDAQRWIITVPHYQGFTDALPLLAQDGVDFEEIAGNDEIMLTLIAPADWKYNLPAGHPLFTMKLLTGDTQQRVAVQVPVKSLGEVLRAIQTRHFRLEHLFDY